MLDKNERLLAYILYIARISTLKSTFIYQAKRSKSFKDYVNSQKNQKAHISCDKLVVRKEIFSSYDLIQFSSITIENFVSDRLKAAIEKEKIAGVMFEQSEIVFLYNV